MPKYKYSSLTFVSHNIHKYREYSSLLGISDLKFSEMQLTEPQLLNMQVLVEQKVEQLKRKLPGTPFFVEHTGLFIDEWKGLPGGLTSLFMDTVGNDGICKMMSAYKALERVARARVVIGYFHPEAGSQIFWGDIVGTIATKPRGKQNFGWDPIFIPEGSDKTYAEMSLEEKNQTSMRKKAAENFIKYLALHFEL